MVVLPWIDKKTVSLDLPTGWRPLGKYEPKGGDVHEVFSDLLADGLDSPVGSPPLESMNLAGKNVTVVVDDATRPTPVDEIFPVLLGRLEKCGVDRSDITVVVALGTHAPMSETAVAKRLGETDLRRLNVVNHDCLNAACLEDMGTTSFGTRAVLNRHICEADLVVLIGTIEPHLIAGFGGGLKNVIPGCAGMPAIAGTHLKVPASERFGVVGKMGEECPTRLAIEEGALMAPCEYFIINTVLNGMGVPVGVFCGDPVEAHRAGCLKAASVFGSPIREKADILISSAWPMNFDFRQATKCLANGMGALKDGGLMIALMACENGVGDVSIGEAVQSDLPVREILGKIGAEAYVKRRLSDIADPDMDEVYMLQFMAEIFRRFNVMIYAPDLPDVFGRSLGLFPIYGDLDELLSDALEMAPSGTVWISPSGGTCYPVGP